MSNTGEIRCQDIVKRYEGTREALSSVSFSIPANGIFAVIGRNGAGKTTLARIMSTLLEPTAGTATIDGLDVMRDAKELRERMAVVPQEGRSIPWMTPVQTISAYLLWRGLSYRDARRKARDAVSLVGLEDRADVLTRRLSGGMKRKVLVAMAIASESEFVFLDEPTTGLDPISRQELWELLLDLGKRRFVFLTTHYLEEAEQVADRIGILDQGRLLAMGTMSELRERSLRQYSLKVPRTAALPPLRGEAVVRREGQLQIITDEEEAFDLSRRLIDQKVEFSVNPVTLDDIFYFTVAKTGRRVENVEEEQ